MTTSNKSSPLHVTLEVKAGSGESDGGAVHYKQDGERFPQGQPNTVKLNVASPYTFTLTLRPTKVLTYWLIRGEKMEFERVVPPNADDDVSIYRATWSSMGLEVTKRGSRYPLAMEMEIYPGCVMNTTLQAKFYPQHEITHKNWGPEIHSLEYQCQIAEGQMAITILHDKIL
ncbi:hypothetical protein ACOMHN_065339 [Nucella lapillus]